LHFGYTPEEVELRLDGCVEFKNFDADAGLPDGLPMASLARLHVVGPPLSNKQVARVREAWQALARRSRFVLTVRLGLASQTLAQTAKPLGLHLSRVRQLQVLALDSLAQAAAGDERGRPNPMELLDAVEATLRALAKPPA